ncbi:PaaI family thioesterase [Eisenibacter elegans]|jgi:acyl-coenzyme A thioesterase PaaI-like protein|uniref:PaaI family thioesterase n=1 Tax=Eisenibacter elegans TaxID=997 RepID=UPI0003FD9FF0|nr:PaaI family thioesterase [Eisenibacter elegans]
MQNPDTDYIQDFMDGNICFGCGKDNPQGLQIKSHWEGDACVCLWDAHDPKYQGWKGLMNGGILATLIDCHTMGTAMAHAYRSEGRPYDSAPVYMYATGTMTVKYLQPTPIDVPIRLEARVLEVKGRKTIIACEAWAEGIQTASAEVVAIRVVDSSQAHGSKPGFSTYRS